jgi:hypothetical protein
MSIVMSPLCRRSRRVIATLVADQHWPMRIAAGDAALVSSLD